MGLGQPAHVIKAELELVGREEPEVLEEEAEKLGKVVKAGTVGMEKTSFSVFPVIMIFLAFNITSPVPAGLGRVAIQARLVVPAQPETLGTQVAQGLIFIVLPRLDNLVNQVISVIVLGLAHPPMLHCQAIILGTVVDSVILAVVLARILQVVLKHFAVSPIRLVRPGIFAPIRAVMASGWIYAFRQLLYKKYLAYFNKHSR